MPETIKQLRRRFKSITDTKHITHAMEMVSTSKLRKSEIFLNAGQDYFNKMSEIVSRLAISKVSAATTFFSNKNKDSALYILLTSDKGLCGNFNNLIVNFAVKEINKSAYKDKCLFLVGKKGKEYLKKYSLDYKILGELLDTYRIPTKALFEKIVDILTEAYVSEKVGDVYLISYKFISRRKYDPNVQKILPITSKYNNQKNIGGEGNINYIFEPGAEIILEEIIPQYLKSKIYMSFLEQRVCEHSSRMLTMNNSTKNCDELIDKLRMKMNKARQNQITKEIIDIISGAEAIL